MGHFKSLTIESGACRRLDMSSGQMTDRLKVTVDGDGIVAKVLLRAEVEWSTNAKLHKISAKRRSLTPPSGVLLELEIGRLQDGSTFPVTYDLGPGGADKWFDIRYTVIDMADEGNTKEVVMKYRVQCQ
ncbi:MAG: hypothetical protein JNN32_06905 [Flavobacteriales bacterium]|nr:hypothetical protein [Flavobacteriales bacterium]